MEPNTLEREAMKFVINGRSFDTANASIVAIHRGVYDPYNSGFNERGAAEEVRFERTIYRTSKGAFFLHEHQTAKYAKGKPVVTDTAYEYSPAQVVEWIGLHGAAVVDATGLDLPEEA